MISNSETLLASESGYILPANYGDYAENKDKDGNVIVPKLTMDVVDKVLKICKENGIKLCGTSRCQKHFSVKDLIRMANW